MQSEGPSGHTAAGVRTGAAPGAPTVTQPEEYRLLTPERVSLQYEIAGLGSRAAAALVDVAIQTAIFIALFLLVNLVVLRFFDAFRDDGPPLVFVIALIVFFLGGFILMWGYYMLFELFWSGQTPGKRMVGIRVIRENGYPIRTSDAIVRNLVRIVDGPPFGAALGAFIMIFNSRARRAGDFAAGTIVVREGKAQRLNELAAFSLAAPRSVSVSQPTGGASAPTAPPTTATAPSSPGPVVALTQEDAILLRDFLVRRHSLAAAPRAALAARLAAHVSRRYGLVRPEPMTTPALTSRQDESFLETLASA